MYFSWRKIVGSAIALAIGFAISQTGSPAQSFAAAGKFKLPFDAKVGKKALPTGDYRFSVSSATLNGKIYIYQGTRAVSIIQPQAFDNPTRNLENPVLVCIRHDGEVTLRALKLPKLGTLYFPLPKEMNSLVAQEPQLLETINVQVSGD
jgi:hypothetical protein